MSVIEFRSGGYGVTLHPPRPDSNDWHFEQSIDLYAAPFRGSLVIHCSASVHIFETFCDELESLYSDLKGEAKLLLDYEDFSLTLKGDGRGHIQLLVEAQVVGSGRSKLNFQFAIDQTDLPAAIAAAKAFGRAFEQPE